MLTWKIQGKSYDYFASSHAPVAEEDAEQGIPTI